MGSARIELYKDDGSREDWQALEVYTIDVESSTDLEALEQRLNNQLETLPSYGWSNWFCRVSPVDHRRVTEETFLDAAIEDMTDQGYI